MREKGQLDEELRDAAQRLGLTDAEAHARGTAAAAATEEDEDEEEMAEVRRNIHRETADMLRAMHDAESSSQ